MRLAKSIREFGKSGFKQMNLISWPNNQNNDGAPSNKPNFLLSTLTSLTDAYVIFFRFPFGCLGEETYLTIAFSYHDYVSCRWSAGVDLYTQIFKSLSSSSLL